LGVLALLITPGCSPPNLDNYTQNSNSQVNLNNSNLNRLEEENQVVLAILGENLITLGDVERQLNRLSPHGSQRIDFPTGRIDFANSFIQANVLAHEAKILGYGVDPTIAYRTDEAVSEVILSRLIADYPEEPVNDAERAQVLEEQRTILNRPNQVRVYINVLEEHMTDQSWQSLLETNQSLNLQDRLNHFQEWTLQSSIEETSRERSGDLGFINIDTLTLMGIPEHEEIFEENIQGNLIGPYSGGLGVFYLFLLEKRNAVITDEERLHVRVEETLERAQHQDRREEILMALREQAEITIDNDLLASLDSSPHLPLQEENPFDALSHLSQLELHHRLTPTYDLSGLIEQLQLPGNPDEPELTLE
jgi:hypothetical protein